MNLSEYKDVKNMKKILILGSNGFIGKNIKEYFNQKLDLYEIISPTRDELDILNYDRVYEYLSQNFFDIILNCLDSIQPDYMEKRLRMFENLRNCNHLYGKMFYFGSGAEYGKDLPIVSITEKEFTKKIPNDTYGLCMHIMSEIAMRSENIYNFRLFGIFGKYEKWQNRFISNSICKALHGYPITIRKDVVFDYLYVDDLCKIVEWAINSNLKYHDYNCVSGQKYTLTQLAEYIKNAAGKKVPTLIASGGLGNEYTASNQRLCDEMKDIKLQDIKKSIENLCDYYKEILDNIDKMNLLYQ